MGKGKVGLVDKENYQIKWRRRSDKAWLPVLWYSFFVASIPYLVWRTALINWDTWYGVVMYIAELYGILTTGLFLFVAKKIFVPLKNPPLKGKTVDVLIPTYTEPLDILEPVVIGATKIEGARQVLVLDDGNRPEVKAMAKRLKVKYFARTNNRHAKAGNLNNGLKHTDAEFIITLDADHIPLPNFIEEASGFFRDPLVAFVQTPQTFYNTHTFLFKRRLFGQEWSEQMMFYNCLQPAKNSWNAAFFVGTSAVLRRAAIDEVGGFATETATEDIHTSLRIHAKGWRSVFLPKPLAYGLEAENFQEFYKQRRRWAAGSLGLLFRSADSPLRAHGLTLTQRLNYLSACLAHLNGVQKLCFLLVPILTIFTNVAPINGDLGYYAIGFGIYFTIALSATWAYSRGTYSPIYTEMFAIANTLAHLGGVKGIFKVQKKFSVSSKSPRRQAGGHLVSILWGLNLLSLIAVARATASYVLYDRATVLVLICLMLIAINSLLLSWFLIKLRSYEKDESIASYLAMRPLVMYRYITFEWPQKIRPRALSAIIQT